MRKVEVKRKRKKPEEKKAANGVNILKRHTNKNNVYRYEELLSFHLVLFN